MTKISLINMSTGVVLGFLRIKRTGLPRDSQYASVTFEASPRKPERPFSGYTGVAMHSNNSNAIIYVYLSYYVK